MMNRGIILGDDTIRLQDLLVSVKMGETSLIL
jgi:hypothetical protein